LIRAAKLKVVARTRTRARDRFELVAVLVAITVVAAYLAAFFVLTTGCVPETPKPPPPYYAVRAILIVVFSVAAALALVRGILLIRSGRHLLGGAYVALSPVLLFSSVLRVMILVVGGSSCGTPP
jgi:uncharacterized membrane protein YozB (DUF420 family)